MEIPVSRTAGLRPHPSNWKKEPEKASTHCLYCSQPVPNHTTECVVPQRTVVVQFTTMMVISMPRCFDEEAINFAMNDSSACMSRYVEQLEREANQEEGMCHICARSEMKYIREASAEDHEQLSYIAEKQDQ